MKVKELIQELQEIEDQEAIVMITGDYDSATSEVLGITLITDEESKKSWEVSHTLHVPSVNLVRIATDLC